MTARGLLSAADALIHDLGREPAAPAQARPLALLIALIVSAAVYGACMGSFSAYSAARVPQIAYAAIKVPMLVVVTSGLCMPGFVVLNLTLGLGADLGSALRAIAFAQCALGVALGSLAPFPLLVYASGASHDGALIGNAVLFSLATAIGHTVMRRRYRELSAQPEHGGRHRVMLWVWTTLYAFVGMQMGWMLRPFVGSPGMPAAFLREEPFTNAYIEIIDLFLRW